MDQVADPIGAIRQGNEWVVAARLSDATFFLGEDRKRRSPTRRPASRSSPSTRSSAATPRRASGWRSSPAGSPASWGSRSSRRAARDAARLAKVDLVTEMVKEFTDLQGVVGGLYAAHDGASAEIAEAIYDHYRPKSESDEVPRGEVGSLVALADKLDALAGFFGLNLIPSGSKDPYALRRAAQGVVRILLEKGWGLDLDRASAKAAELLGAKIPARPEEVASGSPPSGRNEPAGSSSERDFATTRSPRSSPPARRRCRRWPAGSRRSLPSGRTTASGP